MKPRFSFFSFVVLNALFCSALQAADTDKDGCWSGYHPDGGSCVEFTSERRSTRMFAEFSNRCDARIHITWCVGGQCGAQGLRPRQSISKYVNTSEDKTKVYATGSTSASKDQICVEKENRW